MNENHPVFETPVVGFVFGLSFMTTFCFACPELGVGLLKWLFCYECEVRSVSETLAIIVVIGAILGAVGRIIQMASIAYYQERNCKDKYRKELAKCIRNFVKNDDSIPDSIRKSDQFLNGPDDPFFAWVQYSDVRSPLREWGRRRLWYKYVAENWIVAICLGLVFGLTLGLFCLLTCRCAPYNFSGNQILALVFAIVMLLFAVCCLPKISDFNRKAEEQMVAIYLAGMMSKPLRQTFLYPYMAEYSVKLEDKDIPEKDKDCKVNKPSTQ